MCKRRMNRAAPASATRPHLAPHRRRPSLEEMLILRGCRLSDVVITTTPPRYRGCSAAYSRDSQKVSPFEQETEHVGTGFRGRQQNLQVSASRCPSSSVEGVVRLRSDDARCVQVSLSSTAWREHRPVIEPGRARYHQSFGTLRSSSGSKRIAFNRRGRATRRGRGSRRVVRRPARFISEITMR